jgi:signal transduction histidine kinase
VDNAIKFTPDGGTVSVRCEPVDDRFGVIIRDTGIGIEAEHLPHIFERFYRVDPSRSREAGGTGLGLAIGRAIAEAHGGCIRIESTPGVGTEATLLLPPLSPAAASDQKVTHEGTPQGRRAPALNGHQADASAKERLDQCTR